VSRDPRFDNLSGKFNENMFEKAYSFLDDIRNQEKEVNNVEFDKAFSNILKVFLSP
jgi:ribosomal RNA-processing protein 36